MSLSIRLCTKNVKLRLIAWACLAFAVKHPSASVRIPVKTVQAIYGTAFSAATAKSLRALRWNDGDGAEHPTFAAVESAPGKTQTWWVSFNVQLVDTARHLSPEAIILNIYSGLPDISRWIFQMTVDELDGRLPPLTTEDLRTILYRTIRTKQTPEGSAVPVKPRSCPLCASRDISTIFYGSREAMHVYLKKNQRGRSMVSVGDNSISGLKPRWECLGCGIKFWEAAGTDAA